MMRNRLNGTALWCAALLALVALGTAVSAGAKATAPTVKVFFGQGEQLVAVQRPGATVQDALTALVAGPTSAEQQQTFRSYVPAGTRVRSVTQDGHVATVDLGVGFLQGPAVDTTLARLDQVVSTVTAVPGVTSVRLLINGGTPLGLFPGVDATVPLDARGAGARRTCPPRPAPSSSGPATSAARARCSSSSPGSATCCSRASTASTGRRRQAALIAFQKWQGLPRTGALQTRARARRSPPPSGRRRSSRAAPGGALEVLDRPSGRAGDRGQPGRAHAHVSTGKPSTPTPIGSFQVYAQVRALVVGAVPRVAAVGLAVRRRRRDAPVPRRAAVTRPRTAACA